LELIEIEVKKGTRNLIFFKIFQKNSDMVTEKLEDKQTLFEVSCPSIKMLWSELSQIGLR